MIRRLSKGKYSDSKMNCEICLGRGYRDVLIPNGYKLCPDCDGLAKVPVDVPENFPGGGVVKAGVPCSRCNSRGVVRQSGTSLQTSLLLYAHNRLRSEFPINPTAAREARDLWL
jgi:hypothetical protein